MTAARGISWSHNPLPLRRRPDLISSPSFGSPTTSWLIKDPVSLRYYELREEEHLIWQLLDGRRTWAEVEEAYAQAFAPRRIDGTRLSQLLEMLHERGLVSSDRPGQGTVLRRRGSRLRRNDLLRRFANPLAIRLPGLDPHPLLDRLGPIVAPLFSLSFVAVYVVLCALAVLTGLVHADDLGREIRSAASTPNLADASYLLVAIASAKLFHELAHAVSCRRFGGECRELGLLLLCGIPSLYCDVSSMWVTPERWKRVLVGAAGVAAEVLLAAAALLLWRFTMPGTVHTLALYLAVVCSVATVAVNANPLLRYDGYFVLSDLLGMVNLGEQANAACRSITTRWFFGESLENERAAPTRHQKWLAVYAIASVIYRWMITLAVLWWVRRWLAPHGLTVLSDVLTIAVVGSLLVSPVRGAVRLVKVTQGRGLRDRYRPVLRMAAVVLLLTAILAWPWPYNVAAPVVVRLNDAEYVYVVVGGTLTEGVPLGANVQPDDVLARLVDPQLRLEVQRLAGEVGRRRLEIETLERRRVADPSAGDSLPQAKEQLAATERQWRHLADEESRLTIRAKRAGTVLPLFGKAADDASTKDEPTRSSPLEPHRRGAYLSTGTPLCAVGEPAKLAAELLIDQHDVEFVRPGQTVRLRIDAAPDQIFTGRIVEIAEVTVSDVPDELSTARDLGSKDIRRSQASQTQYMARVEFTSDHAALPTGSVGRAKIEATPQSIARRFRRWWNATIRFVWNAP